jgi:cyclic pyranopterin phosphate synthase
MIIVALTYFEYHEEDRAMVDSCGRKIDYLRLSVTDLCNYRCQYCMPAEGVPKRSHEEMLTLEELAEIGEAAVQCGVKKIRLTGGEPLVRRGILTLCHRLRRIPGLEELCLTTNGALLPAMAAPLREAGVDRLNISLDTLRPDRFAAMTRRGALEEVLAGIAAAEAAGFSRLKLDTVLIGGFNDDEIGDFLDLTRHHPWEVRFIELMPMGPCAAWEKSCFLPVDAVLQRNSALQYIGVQGVARRYRLPGAMGTVGLISPVSHAFCDGCSRIRVTADGHLKGCLHSSEEISLRGLHGDALAAAIRQGILQKPLRHHLAERPSDTPRDMNQIGG